MYENLFVELKPQKFETLGALEEVLRRKPEYRKQSFSGEKIKLNDDGQLSYNGSKSRMSLEGFRRMVTKIYKIPDPFAKRIPLDALQYNITRLGKELQWPLCLIFNEDGLIVNAVEDELKSVKSLPLLSSLEGHNIRSISYSDERLDIQTTNPLWKQDIEPRVGDITGCGVNFVNSETGFATPRAETLLWTLVCSNGAILSKRFGGFKINLRGKDIDPESISRTFQYKLEKMIKQADSIPEKLCSLNGKKMTAKIGYSVLRSAAKLVGNDVIVDKFDMEEEDYSNLRHMAKLEETKDNEVDLDAYELYYGITELANSYYGHTRRRLQKIGGSFLELELAEVVGDEN